MERFAALILGSGQGGKLLALHLARNGKRTVVVERRGIGGSCPNIACLPSKNEIWSAKVAYQGQTRSEIRDERRIRFDRHGEGPTAQARHGRG
jgi:pyruvate/2-oxoglutarate dehydrogenase complex dihydrolipoamide dehydrogenase (E3) component